MTDGSSGRPTVCPPHRRAPLAGGATFGARAAMLAMLLSGACQTAPAAVPDNQVTFDQVASKWTVGSDDTWSVDADVSIRAPKDNPSHVVRMPLTWSTGTEKLEVLQARIDKPDGRSLVLPKEAIRDDPPTGDMYFHEFTDEDRLIITFSNVETGDLLVVKTRRSVFHPRVPGVFMAAPVLDRGVGWEETNYTISVPADMPLHYETRVFDHQSETIRDRIVHYFHAPKVPEQTREVTVLGQFDRLPRFAVSTFRDWDAFAAAYASVFTPHAKVTPAIAAMSAKLTEGQTDPREQARLLYEWVRDHIRVVPIPLEESNPEPHDAEQVMTKLYGDNKDHVVLLYALLAARGIPAEFVLLNDTNDSTIADPPNLRPMNHLILYLPGFKTYIDSTKGVAPFGILPFTELGKPAIHLNGSSGLARRDIPLPASGDTLADMKTDMTMEANGDVTGTTTTMARGAFGLRLRGAARAMGENNPGAAATLLRQHGTSGTGTFSFSPPTTSPPTGAPPTGAGDDYTVTGTFRLDNHAQLLRGGFFMLWTGLRLLPRPGDTLAGPMFLPDIRRTEPTFCYPGVQTEELSMTLPEGRALGGLPPDIKIDNDVARYRSHWATNGRQVTVTREFQSLAPKLVCDGRVRDEMADTLAKVRADLVTPVGIGQDSLPPSPADTAKQ